MWDWIEWLLTDTPGFSAPSGTGAGWTPALVSVHVFANLAIAGSFAAISYFLARVARSRTDLPIQRVTYAFCAFILLCAIGRVQEAAMFVWPAYRLQGLVHLLACLSSFIAVIGLPPLWRTFMQHRLAQRNLDLFENVFQESASGIAVVSLHGNLVRVNPAFCRITRRTAEELEAMGFGEITPEPYRSQDFALFGQLLNGAIPNYQMEKPYLIPGGTQVWVLLVASLIRDASGRPIYALGMVTDINDRVHAQQELHAFRTELESKAKTLAERVAELTAVSRGTADTALTRLSELVDELRERTTRRSEGTADA